MRIIGITGSSGAGKSTVCKLLEDRYEAEIIDADEVAKKLSKKGTMYFNSIVDTFGNNIVDKKGELNRKKLADIIFEDEKKREELNKLTFMYIVEEIKRIINKLGKKKMIVIDAPLLYESRLNEICDFVIAVVSDHYKQITRITLRDDITREEAERRLNAQNTNEFFVENAEFILYNNDDNQKELQRQIEELRIFH